jgi:DnaK suppressor protein|tara:strand:+ start:50 stop:394 length:345 start_codon:yes stop_codon:yes gene_type:complete
MDNSEMRQKLLQMREQLQSTAITRNGSAQVVELDQSKVGRLSRMDALQAQEMAKASVLRSQRALMQISAALERIENNEFGVCQYCDQTIAPLRLQVDPAALLCIRCASAEEDKI